MVSGVCLVVSGVCLVLSSVCLVVSGPYSGTCVHVVSENEGPIIETNIRICNEIFGSEMPPLPLDILTEAFIFIMTLIPFVETMGEIDKN